MTELLDYHGYGNSRLTSGTLTAKKTFIGQYADTETSLSYLNARYYDSVRGQFLSEDSVFLGMGTGNKKVQLALLDPQLQNSYSYARDNPMTLKDADGNWPQWMSLGSLASAVNAVYNVITLGAGDRAAEMGRSGVTVGGVAHVVGGVAFGTVSVSLAALDIGAAAGSLAIDVGVVQSGLVRSIPKTGVVGGPGAGKAFPDSVKDAARAESNNTCVFCGAQTSRVSGPQQSNIDHAIPKSVGGSNVLDNAQNTCRTCNLQKGTLTTVQFAEKRVQVYIDKK